MMSNWIPQRSPSRVSKNVPKKRKRRKFRKRYPLKGGKSPKTSFLKHFSQTSDHLGTQSQQISTTA